MINCEIYKFLEIKKENNSLIFEEKEKKRKK